MNLTVNISTFSIKIDDCIISFSQSPQYLYLYAYLAYEKITNFLGTGGFLYPADIQKIPLWDKKKVESIGKEIRRHMQNMEKKGVNIIEFQQRIKGPFRLTINPKEISFDKEIKYVSEFLSLDIIYSLLKDESEAQKLYKYTETISQGAIFFNQGKLKKALDYYESALKNLSLQVEYKAILLQKIARIYERQGLRKEAINKLNRALKLIKKETFNNYLMEAKILSYLGWMYYRERNFLKSQKIFYQSLDLLRGKRHYLEMGEVYNGLGLLNESIHNYIDALSYFNLALNYWSNTDYLYGIQSIFFNIGNLYYKWGFFDKGRSFGKAKQWIEQCINLCDTAQIGQETSQAEILMVEIFLEWQKIEQARKYAIKAKRMALKAHNALDLSTVNKLFGILHFKRKKFSTAKYYFEKSKFSFKRLNFKIPIKEIDGYLTELAKT